MATTAAAPVAATSGIDFDTAKEIGYYRLVWRRFKSRRIALVAAGVLAFVVAACVVIPFFLPADTARPGQLFLGLSAEHPFGTDESGRDLFTRVLLGGRTSLLVGLLAMLATIFIATLVGALGGFFGGITDSLLSALTNAFLSMPALLVLVIYAQVLNHKDVFTVVTGIALVAWTPTARIVRSVVLSLREKEYVEAVRALGTSRPRIILRHILPNALGTIIVSASLTIAAAILLESALSFLGVGIGEPLASWGSLLSKGDDAITSQGDFLYALWPGLAILTVVLCFSYLGDALNDAFDPRALER